MVRLVVCKMSATAEALKIIRQFGLLVYATFTREHWVTLSKAKHETLDKYRQVFHADIDGIMETAIATMPFTEVNIGSLAFSPSGDPEETIKAMVREHLDLLKRLSPNTDITVRNLVEVLMSHMAHFLYLYELQ